MHRAGGLDGGQEDRRRWHGRGRGVQVGTQGYSHQGLGVLMRQQTRSPFPIQGSRGGGAGVKARPCDKGLKGGVEGLADTGSHGM